HQKILTGPLQGCPRRRGCCVPMLLLPVTPHHRRTGLPELLQQPQMRLHGSLELMYLVRRQDVLEDGGVVSSIPTCRRCQAPGLGSSRQAHPQRHWKRKVLTEELTQASMVLARPQEVEYCGGKALWHRLLQQLEVFGSEHDEMWPLSCDNGLLPPGAQAGDERVLTCRRFVFVSGNPDVCSTGRSPLDRCV